MKVRNIVLSGAAALALVGGFAVSSVAQDANNPPQYSTPAEKAQTEQLNQNAQDGTTASPDRLNGDPNAPSNSATQAQYQQQQDQYQQDQQNYQERRAHYDAQRDRYERDIHRYDEARYYFDDYPHAYRYAYDDARLRRLYLIADPTHQLAGAPVEGPNGEWVGRVRNVETDVDGRPRRVQIALNHRVAVWVMPRNLRFDADNHVLFTDMTRADLWNLPGNAYNS